MTTLTMLSGRSELHNFVEIQVCILEGMTAGRMPSGAARLAKSTIRKMAKAERNLK